MSVSVSVSVSVCVSVCECVCVLTGFETIQTGMDWKLRHVIAK